MPSKKDTSVKQDEVCHKDGDCAIASTAHALFEVSARCGASSLGCPRRPFPPTRPSGMDNLEERKVAAFVVVEVHLHLKSATQALLVLACAEPSPPASPQALSMAGRTGSHPHRLTLTDNLRVKA